MDALVDQLEDQVATALRDLRPTLGSVRRALKAVQQVASISLALTREIIARLRRIEDAL